VLNSTDLTSASRYSPYMATEPIVDDGLTERWAAWQERGAENDRRTRRKLFLVTAIVFVSAAVLYGLAWL
jgi:hypothetical protein